MAAEDYLTFDFEPDPYDMEEITCCRCGKKGLYFEPTADGERWVLVDGSDRPHRCSAARVFGSSPYMKK
jgi:hypothetical protein